MIFLCSLTYMSFKGAWKLNYTHKLNSDDKILLLFIKRAWCTCTFLNHFRDTSE